MFHIVFDKRGAELISEAMDMDNTLDGEIILIHDDYSIGPIKDLHTESGRIQRADWFRNIGGEEKNITGEKLSEVADHIILEKILSRMEQEEFDEIWIWLAPNTKDVCGYYWLISQVKNFSGRVYILSLNNLPFIGEKGNIFYPVFLSEIPSREFVKAKKLARPISPAEFETDPDEWIRCCAENKNLRLVEGVKKIISREDDYFDKTILHSLQSSFQKIARAVQVFLLKSPDKINDSFVLWRLRKLMATGMVEQQGESVRLFAKSTDEVSN